MKKCLIPFVGICISGSALAQASAEGNKLPGNQSLPSTAAQLQQIAAKDQGNFKYKVEDYFARPKQSSFQFSPNGKYLSYKEKDVNGKRNLYVKNTETGAIQLVLAEKEELIDSYFWIDDNRILYTQDHGGNENYQLFAVSVDGKNPLALTPFKDVTVSVLKVLKEQPGMIIIQMNKNNPEIFEPYRLDVNTGALVQLFENKDPLSPISGYDFDKDGVLRAYTKQEDLVNYTLYYRPEPDAKFQKIVTTSWKDNFSIIGFDYTTDYPHDAYVMSNLTSNTTELLRYDLKTNKVLDKLYSNPTYDVDGLSTSRKRKYEIDFYSYTGEKGVIIPVSETYKKIHAALTAKFDGKPYGIVNYTDAEDKYLFYVGTDRSYGAYYTYETATGKITQVFDLMPQLHEADMAEMRPFSFKSRDGLTIYGYLTIPNNIPAGGKVPLIVNPHGGPYGPRDNWGFNPETQLFASRGYATIQVNYRGSGGYGKDFLLAGSKQIGRNMLNDLEDAVAYARTLGFVDEKRIAIYGGSYGGLATLGSLVKTPDLYVCGVDYVGVSNLFTFFEAFPPYWKPFLGQVYEQWYNPDNAEEVAIMKAVSPALNADKITKPLFVVQGANDPRVNINESDQVVTNLRSRGVEVPYLVKYNEGHGFAREENTLELYKTMLGFFAEHLK